MNDGKKWYLSKTILVNVLAGVALIVGQFIPSVATFLGENFSAVGGGWTIVNIALRLITKEEIS